jgi:Arc/MetJ-type ribon-helix-helix transcriptional regulator
MVKQKKIQAWVPSSLAEWIDSLVEKGEYLNPSDAVRDLLRRARATVEENK